MAASFDVLGYKDHLRKAGVPEQQATGHAEAARDFIMSEMVTNESLRLQLDKQSSDLKLAAGIMVAGGVATMITVMTAIMRFLVT